MTRSEGWLEEKGVVTYRSTGQQVFIRVANVAALEGDAENQSPVFLQRM